MYGITFEVSVIVSSVRPWNAWSKQTIASRPVAMRAILTAFSTASAPEFCSSAFFANAPGCSSQMRRQTSMYGSYIETEKHWWR